MEKDSHIDDNDREIYSKLKDGLDKRDKENVKKNAKRAIQGFHEKNHILKLQLPKRNFRSTEDRFNWNIQDIVTFKVSKVCNL